MDLFQQATQALAFGWVNAFHECDPVLQAPRKCR